MISACEKHIADIYSYWANQMLYCKLVKKFICPRATRTKNFKIMYNMLFTCTDFDSIKWQANSKLTNAPWKRPTKTQTLQLAIMLLHHFFVPRHFIKKVKYKLKWTKTKSQKNHHVVLLGEKWVQFFGFFVHSVYFFNFRCLCIKCLCVFCDCQCIRIYFNCNIFCECDNRKKMFHQKVLTSPAKQKK